MSPCPERPRRGRGSDERSESTADVGTAVHHVRRITVLLDSGTGRAVVGDAGIRGVVVVPAVRMRSVLRHEGAAPGGVIEIDVEARRVGGRLSEVEVAGGD